MRLVPLTILLLPVYFSGVRAKSKSIATDDRQQQQGFEPSSTSCVAQDDCNRCDTACNTGHPGLYIAERNECLERLKMVKEHMSAKEEGRTTTSLSGECAFDTCYERMRKLDCGLKLSGDSTAKMLQLAKRVWKLRARHKSTERRYLRTKAWVEKSSDYAYHQKLQKALRVIESERVRALKTRQYNHELKEYLSSLEFRKMQQDVRRLKLENKERRRQYAFWQDQNRTLAMSVRTSPLELKNAFGRLQDVKARYEADVELVAVLRASSLSKEAQMSLVTQLKENVQRELAVVQTTHAHARTELAFLRKAKKELHNLLTTAMKEVRANRVNVECGGAAVGKMLGSAVLG